MKARFEKDFNPHLNPVGRTAPIFTVEDCGAFPSRACQLTARTAHALRVQLKPTPLPVVPGFAFQALSRPVAFVGGDYFHFLATDGPQLGVLIFDVSGKGPEAALVAARLRALFQHAWNQTDVKEVLLRVNDALDPTLLAGHFATALYGVLDPVTRRFRFARAGHEPLVLARSGQAQTLAPQGLPLGLGSHEEFAEALECEEVALEAGDRLFFFTDGLTEARNTHDEEFGLDRVLSELRTCAGDDVKTLATAVAKFTGRAPQHDDLTLLSIRVLEQEANALQDT